MGTRWVEEVRPRAIRRYAEEIKRGTKCAMVGRGDWEIDVRFRGQWGRGFGAGASVGTRTMKPSYV